MEGGEIRVRDVMVRGVACIVKPQTPPVVHGKLVGSGGLVIMVEIISRE